MTADGRPLPELTLADLRALLTVPQRHALLVLDHATRTRIGCRTGNGSRPGTSSIPAQVDGEASKALIEHGYAEHGLREPRQPRLPVVITPAGTAAAALLRVAR